MADQTEDDALIREIDAEMREEQMHKLWKAYGNIIIGVAVAIVAIVAGYQGWNTYTTNQRMSEGEQFNSAVMLSQSGDIEGAITDLQMLGENAGSGYGVLARFREAALLSSRGDNEGAAFIYRALGEDKSVDSALSGMALVLGAFQELGSSGAPRDDLIRRLGTINHDASPWRHSAREVLALIAVEQGRRLEAAKLLGDIATDATAPQGIRSRAKNLAAQLGT